MVNIIAQKSVFLNKGFIIMIIMGDKDIPYETIEKINTIDDIKLTKPNSTIYFKFDKNMMHYCMTNDIAYMVEISNITESIYANSLKAKYILSGISSVQTIQKLAEVYLFDSKIISSIASEDEIEKFALQGIDGVIFKDILR